MLFLKNWVLVFRFTYLVLVDAMDWLFDKKIWRFFCVIHSLDIFFIFRAENDCPNVSDKNFREELSESSENDARSISVDSTMEEINQVPTVRMPLVELEVTYPNHIDAQTFETTTSNDL